jgi:hypothetical protein
VTITPAPAAVGVKVAAGDRPVVACIGDGSWMFGNPQVTASASAFHKAPVLFIVWNNRGYRTGTNEVLRTDAEGYAATQQDLTGGWFDPCPNCSGEAAASGAYGEKVTDPREVAPAISPRAGSDAAGRRPCRAGHVDAEARHERSESGDRHASGRLLPRENSTSRDFDTQRHPKRPL